MSGAVKPEVRPSESEETQSFTGPNVKENVLKGPDETVYQANGAKSGPQAVPLRLRQLPASFWKEPNRPKTELHPLSALSLSYLGQNYKQFQPMYKDVPVPDYTYIPGNISTSSLNWGTRRDSASDYMYRNYVNKYHATSSKFTDLNWNYFRFPEDDQKPSSRTFTALAANPFALSTCQRRSYSGELSYPGTCSDPPSGLWGGVTMGQYPTYTLPQNTQPWRPLSTKSTSSYPPRYHPFAV